MKWETNDVVPFNNADSSELKIHRNPLLNAKCCFWIGNNISIMWQSRVEIKHYSHFLTFNTEVKMILVPIMQKNANDVYTLVLLELLLFQHNLFSVQLDIIVWYVNLVWITFDFYSWLSHDCHIYVRSFYYLSRYTGSTLHVKYLD